MPVAFFLMFMTSPTFNIRASPSLLDVATLQPGHAHDEQLNELGVHSYEHDHLGMKYMLITAPATNKLVVIMIGALGRDRMVYPQVSEALKAAERDHAISFLLLADWRNSIYVDLRDTYEAIIIKVASDLNIKMDQVILVGYSSGATASVIMGLSLGVRGVIADGILTDFKESLLLAGRSSHLQEHIKRMPHLPFFLYISNLDVEKQQAVKTATAIEELNSGSCPYSLVIHQRAARVSHVGYIPDIKTVLFWLNHFDSVVTLPSSSPVGVSWLQLTRLPYFMPEREFFLTNATLKNWIKKVQNDVGVQVYPSTQDAEMWFHTFDVDDDGIVSLSEYNGFE